MDNDLRQQHIVNKIRHFADDVIRPMAGKFDREECLPREIIDEMAKKKFLLAGLPETNGGLGLNAVYYGFFTEEIGKACCSVRGLITVHRLILSSINIVFPVTEG